MPELIERGHAPLPFVGGASQRDLPRAVAATIRRRLALTDGWAANTAGVEAALSELREKIESVGVLIVVNGVVGNNTHRKLDPTEFRGFALVDGHAPLIFVNGADAKSAQMFTFAHELAHIWLGEAGVSDLDPLRPDVGPSGSVEALCNAAAAELVVPEAELRARWAHAAAQQEPYRVLARAFKVSPIVCARRALETDLITREAFFAFYEAQARDLASASRKSTGGHFWNTQNVRVGKRFGAAVVAATREGRLLYHEAYRLTDLRGETFEKFARSLGY
jgi:Zn-dependent peptidase ImmA (M78 family)